MILIDSFYLAIALKSFATGFIGACMVGPVFTLILYKSLTQTLLHGFASAAGMSLADGIFFALAVAGGGVFFSCCNIFSIVHQIGGPLMLLFGILILKNAHQSAASASEIQCADPKKKSYFIDFLTTFILTLSNPMTLFFFGSISTQVLPSVETFTWQDILFSGSFLSLGSFTLLSLVLLGFYKKAGVNPHRVIYFLKVMSGLGLIITGLALTLKMFGIF